MNGLLKQLFDKKPKSLGHLVGVQWNICKSSWSTCTRNKLPPKCNCKKSYLQRFSSGNNFCLTFFNATWMYVLGTRLRTKLWFYADLRFYILISVLKAFRNSWSNSYIYFFFIKPKFWFYFYWVKTVIN